MRSFFSILFCTLFLLPAVVGAEPVATVKSVQPSAVARSEELGTRALAAGGAVTSGDSITTDRRGTVTLSFFDQTVITLAPNSKVDMASIIKRNASQASKFNISAVKGTFRFISGKSSKKVYKIKTPTATIGLRGTQFIVDLTRGDGSTVHVENGAVDFCDSGSCVTVGKGFSIVQSCQGSSCTSSVTPIGGGSSNSPSSSGSGGTGNTGQTGNTGSSGSTGSTGSGGTTDGGSGHDDNGHGNDPGGVDPSNPGQGGGNGGKK